MFSVNEKIVYPGHGVAVVSQAIEKNIAGHKVCFFELSFLNKDMTILVPVNALDSTGVRRLSSLEKIDDVLRMLGQPAPKEFQEMIASNWNKRNKEYQNKLRTGILFEIACVYRDLKFIATKKELSFGEKNLLQQTEFLLVQEISLVKKIDEDKIVQELRSLCAEKVRHVLMPSNGKQGVARAA